MKKTLSTLLLMAGMSAVQAQDVKLPAANMKQQSKSMVATLAARHSVREFGTRKLTNQELSNLCWAACGVSRDAEHRTSPTAMNKKEIRLFVLTADKVYEYMPAKNTLHHIANGDHRKLLASNGGGGFSQDFVNQAPVSLVMVIDYELFGSQNETALMMGCVDAGNVSENINLYCESVGLVTVPRATHDVAGLRKLLKLTDKQLPIMNNPVGFPKGTK